MKYKIIIIGAAGKMGKIAIETLSTVDNFNIVGSVGRNDNLAAILKAKQPDIALELSNYLSVLENSWTIIKHNVRPVIGASGLKKKDITELTAFCKKNALGGAIIPNFAIASAIANSMASKLAKYFNNISVVEFHHKAKQDKPSGTARYVAEAAGFPADEIASIRSDGFLAKQQIYISNLGEERLIIDHESFSRNSFKKGIQISCEKVLQLKEMRLGLENIL